MSGLEKMKSQILEEADHSAEAEIEKAKAKAEELLEAAKAEANAAAGENSGTVRSRRADLNGTFGFFL